MHGHGKSDLAIVATKLPNKAGQPAAEAVERRAGTKGNTGRHSTRRTQIRESAVPGAGPCAESRKAKEEEEEVRRAAQHRIGDKRIIRLIQKWLKAGILEDGAVTVSDRGTGQRSVASPLLANVYLHYVFDLWAERWRRREATGDMIVVRYADDLVLGFQHERTLAVFSMRCECGSRSSPCRSIRTRPA